MLQFIPALLLLLVNSHLGQPGELGGFLPAQRIIFALSQKPDSPAVRSRAASLAVRALSWINRWQTFAPNSELVDEDAAFSPAVELPAFSSASFLESDRSRDGPS
ncbi:MAG: hypothetical protein JNK63_06305 [Chthonomonas sp.]|nr:hypothetical protein [Chthonomonas sp.]